MSQIDSCYGERLQVILQDPITARFTHGRVGMTIAAWIRQALELARRREALADLGKKLAVVRAGVRHDFPSGDIDDFWRRSRRLLRRQPRVIFVDSNSDVPDRRGASAQGRRAAISRAPHHRRHRLVTDAEVLQEFSSLRRHGRRDAIQPAFDALLGIADQAFPWISPQPNAPRKSSWDIRAFPRVTLCIWPSWNITESRRF